MTPATPSAADGSRPVKGRASPGPAFRVDHPRACVPWCAADPRGPSPLPAPVGVAVAQQSGADITGRLQPEFAPACLLEVPGVVHRHGDPRLPSPSPRPVVVAEDLPVSLVRYVQPAENLAAPTDRRSMKGQHRGMLRGNPANTGCPVTSSRRSGSAWSTTAPSAPVPSGAGPINPRRRRRFARPPVTRTGCAQPSGSMVFSWSPR